jgi:hypothetical protein
LVQMYIFYYYSKEYKTYFFNSLMYLLIYCFSSIFVSLKQSLLTKKNKHPKKINFLNCIIVRHDVQDRF